MTGVLIRERRGRIRPQRPRRDHVEGEADGHKPRNHRELEEAGYSPRVSGGGMVLTPPSFWTSASGTPGDHVSVDLSHPAAGNVFRQPCDTSTVAQIKGGAIWAPNEESTAQRGRPRRLRAVLREAVVPRALQGAARGGQAGRDERGPPPPTHTHRSCSGTRQRKVLLPALGSVSPLPGEERAGAPVLPCPTWVTVTRTGRPGALCPPLHL